MQKLSLTMWLLRIFRWFCFLVCLFVRNTYTGVCRRLGVNGFVVEARKGVCVGTATTAGSTDG